YAVLSYVWGPGEQPTLSAENVDLWCSEGALQQHVDLPLTIKDAVQVVREAGMQFLWVDALCIVQDVDEEKALQISQMDRIYSRAILTLAATEG
ncbi:heterokaryon incompatibility, partial [Lasiosphaeris hirsuta]